MLKNMLLCSVFGSILVFGASACSSNSTDKDAMANGGESRHSECG